MMWSSIWKLDSLVYSNRKITEDGIGKNYNSIVKNINRYIINEVLEGNLLTPARLEEVMKKTKFIKRILNFFMPSKQYFINMEWVSFTCSITYYLTYDFYL